MEKLKISKIIFFIASCFILAIGGILLFALPQDTFSEDENRYLTSIQLPTLSGFMDASMQENLTDGANDQFVGRSLWVKISTALQRAVGFQDIGGVYFGESGYYFERLLDSGLSKSRYLNNLHCVEQFASLYNTKTSFLPVPSKGVILKNFLPANAVLYHADSYYKLADKQLEHADLMDIRKLLETGARNSQMYFKTDHHWTMDAAYLAYTAWCSTYGKKSAPLDAFAPTCASKSFYGTLYSKAPDFNVQPDFLFLPSKLPNAVVNIDENTVGSIYDQDKLDSKDKYGVYFGGNFAKVHIQMENKKDVQNKKTNSHKLLVIKDSFANSMVPFFMENYDEIIMLDFRYYNEPVSMLMETEQPDDTLILYELSNFAQDMNFFKILK